VFTTTCDRLLRVSDDDHSSIVFFYTELIGHQLLNLINRSTSGTGTDEWKRDRLETMLLRDAQGISTRLANGVFRRPPPHADTSNVNDPFERQTAGASQNSTSERYWSVLCDFAKWLKTSSLLDRTGNALRQQEPPWNDIAIPSVTRVFSAS
jgi:hypothetical protein